MTNFKLFGGSIALLILIHGCGEILEPVVLSGGKQDKKNDSFQEEFEIEIKSLTFRSARDANKSPYQRWLMRSGIGAAANLIDEVELLTSNMPMSSKGIAYLLGSGDKLQFTQSLKFVESDIQLPTQTIKEDYLLGFGDRVKYTQSLKFVESDVQFPTQTIKEDYLLGFGDRVEYTQSLKFVESDIQFPTQTIKEDYLLGVGDELTLLQLNESASGIRNIISRVPKQDSEQTNQNITAPQLGQNVLKTSSLVGSDGNILLLDLGSIRAANRSLKSVQTEVRNILIRNGLAPNFQLEITGFNSKKAFVAFPAGGERGNNIVPLTNLPVTLKELVINYGVRPSSDDATVVSLTRNEQKFRMTARQMFKKSSPRIVIKDGDQIEIDEIEGVTEPIETVVGSKGRILIPGVGSIPAKNRSLAEVQAAITRTLTKKGLVPNFQLEITGFNSKKAFVTFPAGGERANNIVPLTNLPVTLKELVINYGVRPSSDDATVVSLTRNEQKFRMTARQMFKKSSPRIVIKDGDQIEIDEIEGVTEPIETVVGSKGRILIPGVGSIPAKNRSLAEVQAAITRTLTKKGLVPNFQLEITGFNSKEFFLITGENGSESIPLDSFELDLKTAILRNHSFKPNKTLDSNQILTIVEITRKGLSYRITLRDVLTGKAGKFYIQDGDMIELQELRYKQGQVFALSGSGNAKAVSISPSKRETLADILFTENGALSNAMASRSEVYLLRGRAPAVAYHLDAQNVSRILVAAETELRPNDIVFVADRPIISFARALNEISPLRMILRDIRLDKLP